jgi:hypothetical protein
MILQDSEESIQTQKSSYSFWDTLHNSGDLLPNATIFYRVCGFSCNDISCHFQAWDWLQRFRICIMITLDCSVSLLGPLLYLPFLYIPYARVETFSLTFCWDKKWQCWEVKELPHLSSIMDSAQHSPWHACHTLDSPLSLCPFAWSLCSFCSFDSSCYI